MSVAGMLDGIATGAALGNIGNSFAEAVVRGRSNRRIADENQAMYDAAIDERDAWRKNALAWREEAERLKRTASELEIQAEAWRRASKEIANVYHIDSDSIEGAYLLAKDDVEVERGL